VNAPTSLRVTLEPTESAEERRAELFRRLDEAADVLAETLLDVWRREHRARRQAVARVGAL